MKQKEIKGIQRKYPIAEVIWEDHHGDKIEEWTVKTEKESLKPELVHSVGFLVTENTKMIELMRDVGYAPDDTDTGAPVRIIKKCIIHFNILA